MLEQGFIEWATGQIGIAGLATFALFMLRNSYISAVDRERQYAESNREDKHQLITVLSKNTEVLTKLTAMIEALRHDNSGARRD